ncbi:MAG: bifunctional phosphoglucose/phosphomannose isomerase [Candidatus Thermoplasmatota archaeon]|nr:bifunctional phosphoglucose/phosphomannose isomerase [Candidatus Thermoplasmatota archaeon]
MLDDPDRLSRIDPSELMGTFSSLPEQIEEGLAGVRDAAWAHPPSGRVFVVGMGGSAIAGDLAHALGRWYGGVEVQVTRTPSIPPYVDKEDLLVAISYSGNTWETLSAYRQALRRDLSCLTVGSGGELAETSSAQGVPHVFVPPGFAPRAALGYLLAPLLTLLARSSVRLADALPGALTDLSRIREEWVPAVPTEENRAKAIATALEGKVPIIYGPPPYAGVARRWQTQLNENAKTLAWHSVLPEANHNEIVGWLEGSDPDRFAPILLMPPPDSAIHARLQHTLTLLEERVPVTSVPLLSKEFVTGLLELVLLGDLVSVYLAVLRGVDPRPVGSIDRLKAAIREGGVEGSSAEGEI